MEVQKWVEAAGGEAGWRSRAGADGRGGRQPVVFPQLPPEASSERACVVRCLSRSFSSLRGARRGVWLSSTRVSVPGAAAVVCRVPVRLACLLTLRACACVQVQGGKVCREGGMQRVSPECTSSRASAAGTDTRTSTATVSFSSSFFFIDLALW